MKALLFIFLTTIVYSIQGQNITYEFNASLNKLISKKNNESPIAYHVKNKKVSKKVQSRQKRESLLYKNTLKALEIAKTDSINNAVKEKEKLARYNELNNIKGIINNFISSPKSYEAKKQKLVKAQKIASKYNLDVLVYADSDINSKNKSKFFMLKLNSLDLKIHLKKVLKKIESQNIKPDFIPFNNSNAIKKAKNQLKNTKRYEFINGPLKTKIKNTLVLDNEVENPDLSINGTFEDLGEYYVLQNKINNQVIEELISIKKAKLLNLKKESFVFQVPATLIKKKDNGTTYLVASGFLNEYSVSKLSQQEKFKDKVSLPFRIYSSVNDRLIDSIIINYNQITLNHLK